jgi:hypothetical protein
MKMLLLTFLLLNRMLARPSNIPSTVWGLSEVSLNPSPLLTESVLAHMLIFWFNVLEVQFRFLASMANDSLKFSPFSELAPRGPASTCIMIVIDFSNALSCQ